MIATPVKALDEQRTVLQGVSWQTYQQLCRDLADQPGQRLAFDRGTLEIMSPSQNHERLKQLIGQLVVIAAEESDQDLASFGSTTWSRADLERGFEPDQCYYLQNEAIVRNRSDLDLAVDPPPDLIVEVDISSSSKIRMQIYQGLGIPEVWQYQGNLITLYCLVDGKYRQCDRSGALPWLSHAMIQQFLQLSSELSELAWMKQWRQQVRDIING